MRPFYISVFIFIFIFVNTCSSIYAKPASLKQIFQYLSAQNGARAALGMQALVWDAGLAKYAELYASKRRRDCSLVHSNGSYGDNLFWGSGTGWMPAHAAKDWVSERRWYNYFTNSCVWGQQCRHYTQIVWNDTAKIGCAMVKCVQGKKGLFFVCEYDPPGNFIGEKPY